MTAAIQSGSMAFKPRARLLKLIGAELISDDVVAMTELVKNAHDADAASVTIEFEHRVGDEGVIVIRDDGDGMSLDTLLGHWMEPAASSKLEKAGKRTTKGRRVLGEKGVGRFAADKLGAKLELISHRRGEKTEIRAVFDWDRFEDETLMLADIKNQWEVRRPVELESHGTVLRISGLRSVWTERMFRRLSARLSRLRSPFAGADGFSIRLQSDEFPEYSGELQPELLDRAPYRMEAHFDGHDTISISLDGKRSVDHEWPGIAALRCGPVRIRIYAFDLETESLAKLGPRVETRAWLKEWSGVSIYRDGFRIWPYGEPHDDWLRLDQRRVNNPVVKLSNNQIVGFIEITADGNPGLVDQTNREGLIHNDQLDDLRRLLQHVLQVLEAERQAQRHPVTSGGIDARGDAPGQERTSLDPSFERLAARVPPKIAEEVMRLGVKVKQEIARVEGIHRQNEQGYAELAAVGQTALGISASVRPLLGQLLQTCTDLEGQIDGKAGSRKTAATLMGLVETVKAVADQVGILIPLDGGTFSGRRRAIDLMAELQSLSTVLAPLLKAGGVRMLVETSDETLLRAEIRPEYLQRALSVLIASLVEGLRHVRQPEMRLSLRGHAEACEILISDNGPGLVGQTGQAMLAALGGHRLVGREGIGLAAARSILEANGARIELVRDGRRRGTTTRILLPRKRSRATVGGVTF